MHKLTPEGPGICPHFLWAKLRTPPRINHQKDTHESFVVQIKYPNEGKA